MPIAFDAFATSTDAVGTSLTWAHTCTGSDLILIVGSGDNDTGSVTGVTYNDVAMTQIGTGVNPSVTAYQRLWYKTGPATGANNCVISSSSSTTLRGRSSSFTGASQTGQPDSTNKAINSGTSISVSTTTVADNCWSVGVAQNNQDAFTAGEGTTIRGEAGIAAIDSNGAKSPAGSYSLNLNITPSASNGMIVASIAPVAAAVANHWLLMGV